MTAPGTHRWEAIDVLRGVGVIGMLFTLNPGAWEHEYGWLVHAKWEGGTLIDMVAPAFLFCIGAVIPLSLQRRVAAGASQSGIVLHILWRCAALVALGLLLHSYPAFDWANVRIPGVLQRIGMALFLVSMFVLATTRRGEEGRLVFLPRPVAAAAAFVLVSYWALLYFVPVPGFGAPRFDPVGSWPAYVDRALFGVDHMFKVWPVDGKVVFDPDGLLSTYPVCFNILAGALTGILYAQNRVRRPAATAFAAGCAMIVLALLLSGICPIIKNIWTSSFALFSTGFSLVLLGAIVPIVDRREFQPLLLPARVFGANPLLAFILCWMLMPALDFAWIATAEGPMSLRYFAQTSLRPIFGDSHASFVFSMAYLAFLGLLLWGFYRKRWFLKL